jgi:hypothetical protein
MDRREIDAALGRVREMQTLVLDCQRFSGFSGLARMSGGAAALATALALRGAVPAEPRLHLIGWGVLLVFGLGANFAGLAAWFRRGGQGVRLAELWPVFETLPALSVGAALSFALIRAGLFCLLWPGLSFTDPRPMGLVFGVGELCGGWALRRR